MSSSFTMAKFLSLVLLILSGSNAAAFTLSMRSESKAAQFGEVGCRRSFLSTACATVVGGTFVLSQSQPSYAATAKEIITTPSGIKYAVTKETSDKKPVTPLKGEAIHRSNGILCPSTPLSLFIISHRIYTFLPLGDFVAIDYTGYLTSGQVSTVAKFLFLERC
jgi:hypothetical protein